MRADFAEGLKPGAPVWCLRFRFPRNLPGIFGPSAHSRLLAPQGCPPSKSAAFDGSARSLHPQSAATSQSPLTYQRMPSTSRPLFRPFLILVLAVSATLLIVMAYAAMGPDGPSTAAVPTPSSTGSAAPAPADRVRPTPPDPSPLGPVTTSPPNSVPSLTPTALATQSPTPSLAPPDDRPSDELRMKLETVIGGRINPKSIESSQTGTFFAQNNIYQHSITVYDRSFQLVRTLRDSVRLSEWGFQRYDQEVQGGPVEAAFTPDASRVYVTQRSMYGPGFTRPGPVLDACDPGDRIDRSFVYEYDVATLERTRVIQVGSLPKDLTVTPDGRLLLVSNWCSYDLSVVDLATGQEVERVPIGPYPRGIAVASDSSVAYVAYLGADEIMQVDLRTFRARRIPDLGLYPRDVLISPDDRSLYISLDGGGGIVKMDVESERVVARAATGREPRSMAMAPDGLSIYVVNWGSGTATKVRTSDMQVIQRVRTGYHPIGITYDDATREVWVSMYPGTIRVYQEE